MRFYKHWIDVPDNTLYQTTDADGWRYTWVNRSGKPCLVAAPEELELIRLGDKFPTRPGDGECFISVSYQEAP